MTTPELAPTGRTPGAAAAPKATTAAPCPYRQIRALYDSQTITVYQAYKPSIATAAVRAQKLDASPEFSPGRMTWIKPSWNWMMYRSGYSFKDAGQARILAIRMGHEDFVGLLRRAELTHGLHGGERGTGTGRERGEGKVEVSDGGFGEDGEVRGAQREEVEVMDVVVDDGAGGEGSNGGRARKEAKKEARARGEKAGHVKVQWDPERTPRLEKLDYRSIQIGVPAALSRQWAEEWIVGIEDVTNKAQELKKALDEDGDVTTEELVQRGLVPKEREFSVPDDVQKLLGMV